MRSVDRELVRMKATSGAMLHNCLNEAAAYAFSENVVVQFIHNCDLYIVDPSLLAKQILNSKTPWRGEE